MAHNVYHTCPDCGAHLDPGETCECQKETSCEDGVCDIVFDPTIINGKVTEVSMCRRPLEPWEKANPNIVRGSRALFGIDEASGLDIIGGIDLASGFDISSGIHEIEPVYVDPELARKILEG